MLDGVEFGMECVDGVVFICVVGGVIIWCVDGVILMVLKGVVYFDIGMGINYVCVIGS